MPALKESRLKEFEEWLREDGRSEGTIRLYLMNLRSCARHPDGITARLIDRELAPKTLRTNLAALQRWADFDEDDALARRLRKIRLPPAVRAKPKTELEYEDWRELIRAIRSTKRIRPEMRAVLLAMALRGLRCGDVLRLRKAEIAAALRTGILSYEAKGRRRLEYSAAPLREPLEMFQECPGSWTSVLDLIASAGDVELKRKRAAGEAVTRALRRCAKAAKLDKVHPHRLRRTYAVHFLKRLAGDPQALLKLQSHMGWSSMATAAGYVDAMNKVELDAVGDALAADLGS